MATSNAYTAESIQVLRHPETTRRRPGMFFGDVTTDRAMHAMLAELIGNAIDEHLRRGTGGYVRVAFDGDRASVEDDGRGLPVEAVETVLTRLHAGTGTRPHVHLRADLGGAGLAPVCALASELEVEIWRAGRAHAQRFACGVPRGPIEDRGATTRTGTRISFTPDFTLLARAPWDVAGLARQGRELAALVPGLAMIVDDEPFCYPDGLVDHVRYLTAGTRLVEPVHLRASHAGVGVELAFAWVEAGAGLHGFVNCAAAPAGTHLDGLLAGLRTVLRKRRIPAARIARDLLAFVHVDLEHPRFGDPSRAWLANEDVGAAVRAIVERELPPRLARSPALLDWILLRTE
jgi:DNA gyrase subunit B